MMNALLKHPRLIAALTVLTLLFISMDVSHAQNKKKEKANIVIELKATDEQGNPVSYSGRYSSQDEMDNDQALKEFKEKYMGGDENHFRLKLRNDNDQSVVIINDEEDVFLEQLDDEVMVTVKEALEKANISIERLHDAQGNIMVLKDGDSDFDFNFDFDFDFDQHQASPQFEALQERMQELREKLQEKGVDLEAQMEALEAQMEALEKSYQHRMIRVAPNGSNVHTFIFQGSRLHIEDVSADDEATLRKLKLENNSLKLQGLNYYPNPNDGKFTLQFNAEANEPIDIRILDLSGKEVYSEHLDSPQGVYMKELDLTDQDSGVYMLQIRQGSKAVTKKILID